MTNEELLTVGKAAQRLGLGPAAVRRAVHRGDLIGMKICGRVRIQASELDLWMERSRISPLGVPRDDHTVQ